jgi:hypothetical protein
VEASVYSEPLPSGLEGRGSACECLRRRGHCLRRLQDRWPRDLIRSSISPIRSRSASHFLRLRRSSFLLRILSRFLSHAVSAALVEFFLTAGRLPLPSFRSRSPSSQTLSSTSSILLCASSPLAQIDSTISVCALFASLSAATLASVRYTLLMRVLALLIHGIARLRLGNRLGRFPRRLRICAATFWCCFCSGPRLGRRRACGGSLDAGGCFRLWMRVWGGRERGW